MTTQGPRSHTYEVNAFLRVSAYSEDQIRKFLSEVCGVKKKRLQSGLHLTVYHSRRPIPGLCEGARPLQIIADTLETRFMPLTPGGENPREDIDPQAHPLGIRLTKRNNGHKRNSDVEGTNLSAGNQGSSRNAETDYGMEKQFWFKILPSAYRTVTTLAQDQRDLNGNRRHSLEKKYTR